MHYLVFVLIPGGSTSIYDDVERLLEGSSANPKKSFPARSVECFCIGSEASQMAWREVDDSPAGARRLQQIKDARSAKDVSTELRLLAERRAEHEEAETRHPRYGKPDSGCMACHGSGVRNESLDPASKWDYWGIGGRWDGFLEKYASNPDLPNELMYNCALVSDLPDDMVPAAIVTPDGLWYEPAKLIVEHPLTPLSQDTQEVAIDWSSEARRLLAAHCDCLAVVVDCHD